MAGPVEGFEKLGATSPPACATLAWAPNGMTPAWR
jgi:hypothetical protein